MRTSLRKRLRLVVETDLTAERTDGVWRARCLHCRTSLLLREDGEPLDGATLEHIVPRAWFEKRSAAALIAEFVGPDDPRNLALACARCNQSKGHGHDKNGPSDARAREVIVALLQRRAAGFLAQTEPDAD